MRRGVVVWRVTLVMLVALIGLGPVVPANAQEADPSSSANLQTLHDCPAEASVLMVLAVAPSDPARSQVLGDLAAQLAGLRDRRIDLLIGSAGAEFQRATAWEQVTPANAPRLAEAVVSAASSDVGILDPAVVVTAAVDEIAQQTARSTDGACGVIVLDPGTSLEVAGTEISAPVGLAAVVVSPERAQMVSDLAELTAVIGGAGTQVETVVACAERACDQGSLDIELSPVLGSFAITAVLPSDTATLEVTLPRGVSFPIADRVDGSISAGSFVIETTWVGPDMVRLNAEVSPTETDWSGTWTVAVINPEPGVDGDSTEATIISSGSVGITPQFTGSVRLVAGRAVILRAELVDARGRVIDRAEALEAVNLVARAVDPGGQELDAIDMEPATVGVWSGSLGLDADVDLDTVTLELVATIASADLDLAPAVAATEVDVLAAEVWPSIVTNEIKVLADSGSQVTEAIEVTAGVGVDACVWIEDAAVDLGAADAAVSLAGFARSAASCVQVPAGTTPVLPLTIDLGDVPAGAYQGSVTVAYGPMGDEAFDTVEVDLLFELRTPINVARRIQITAGMTIIALVVPLLALWLLDWVKARFRPSRKAVAAEAWIAVWSDGSIYRVDTDGSPLLMGNDDFVPAGLSRSRRFQWRGLELGVRNPTSPFTPPVAVVSSPNGPVVASMGGVLDEESVVGRVPLTLAPTWIFELATEATREAALEPTAPDFFASYGRLILIRPTIDAAPVDISSLPEFARRLALTVRRAAQPDTGTAQEMLDFVEVNASAPRDLPRRLGAATESDGDGAQSSGFGAGFSPPPELTEPQRSGLPSADPYDFSDLAGLFASDDEPDSGELTGGDPEADTSVGDDSGEDESGGEAPDEADHRGGIDLGPTDHWDDIEVETTARHRVVLEESVNPEAFLTDGATPEAEAPAPAEPPADAPPPADPRTSWARRSKPNWPSIRRPQDP